jgi:phosphoglycerate kinase
VKYIADVVGAQAVRAVAGAKAGRIVFLENLRFEAGEEKNDWRFAKKLAAGADIYVNEAFSVSHRDHASVSAIKNLLPAYAGILLEQEIANLDKIKNPAKPLVVLMGGAKIKTKINLIKNLEAKAHKILIGGALANNFFKAMGLNIGQSLYDKESVAIAKKLLSQKKIILPLDVVVSAKGGAAVRFIDEIGKNETVFDIGPRTIILFAGILKQAKTIIWNGPLGAFEKNHFQYGTLALGQAVAARSRGKAFGVAGGGETLEALKLTKMEHYVDWISTGGGAMLAYLGGEKMPGLS